MPAAACMPCIMLPTLFTASAIVSTVAFVSTHPSLVARTSWPGSKKSRYAATTVHTNHKGVALRGMLAASSSTSTHTLQRRYKFRLHGTENSDDSPAGSGSDSNSIPNYSASSNPAGEPVGEETAAVTTSTAVEGSGAGGGGGAAGGKGGAHLDGKLISKLTRRLADSFPLLTADEIKMLLNPESKGGTGHSRAEDSLALLIKDVRELVEDLMDQVGTTEDKALVDLKEIAQKFKGVLKGDPATVTELRTRVLEDLEDVREEIEQLLQVNELAKARDKLEKATAESTELVFDSAVTAMVKGIDKVVNEGKDVIQEGEETETLQVSTYIFGQDNEFWDDMQANGVTPRRVFLYSVLGAGVALGGNLFGVTSGLLGSLAPDKSREARLDVLYPVKGFKRFYSPEGGYEFIYPQEWVGDTGLALRRQRDLEDDRASPSAVVRARQRRAAATSPDVAFGPPGRDGIENVSLVKSELMGGFSLKGTLGEPKEAAEKLLSTFIAPPGSERDWELIEAFEDTRAPGGLVYQFEYRIQGKRIRRPMRNVGVVAARGSTLFTVTVLAPEESWGNGRGREFREMAKSFRLTK